MKQEHSPEEPERAACLLVFLFEKTKLGLGIVIHFLRSPRNSCLASYLYGDGPQ